MSDTNPNYADARTLLRELSKQTPTANHVADCQADRTAALEYVSKVMPETEYVEYQEALAIAEERAQDEAKQSVFYRFFAQVVKNKSTGTVSRCW